MRAKAKSIINGVVSNLPLNIEQPQETSSWDQYLSVNQLTLKEAPKITQVVEREPSYHLR